MNTPPEPFNVLKFRLKLAPSARDAALDLKEHDSVEPTKFLTEPAPPGMRIEIASVSFRCKPHQDVISLYIHADGTFSVGSSTCISTAMSMEQLETYARALAFIKFYGLKPWTPS